MQPSVQPHERVRRLWPPDVTAYRAHLLRLDNKARYSRFACIVSDAVIIRHVEKCFGPDCLVYGFFVDGILRAATELHVIEPGSAYTGEAEAAFSVEKGWRHRGVGSILMGRVRRAACNRGLLKVVITCLPQNLAMQSLAKKFGAKLSFDCDEVIGQFAVRLPTASSMFDEMFDDSLGFATAVLELQNRILHPSQDRIAQAA